MIKGARCVLVLMQAGREHRPRVARRPSRLEVDTDAVLTKLSSRSTYREPSCPPGSHKHVRYASSRRHPSSLTPSPAADIKAQLAALAARQSGGKTTDPAALQTPSAINARVPTVGQEDKQEGKKTKAKGKGKMSARQRQRQEKLRQTAVDLGAKIEKKVAAKEGRKVSLTVDVSSRVAWCAEWMEV